MMSTRQRLHLRKFIVSIREDWDEAGVEAKIVELDQRGHGVAAVSCQAILQACNTANRTPEAMTWDSPARPVTAEVPARLEDYNACPEHPKSGHRPDGTCSGCWIDKHADDTAPAFRRSGVKGPSEEQIAAVRKALGR